MVNLVFYWCYFLLYFEGVHINHSGQAWTSLLNICALLGGERELSGGLVGCIIEHRFNIKYSNLVMF